LSSRFNPPEPPLKGTSEQIADRIRSEIESGALLPGASLNQVGLASRFGLSRIPVREALRRLEAEGYITYRPNKGATVVASLAPADVMEILEIRECIETRLMEHVLHHVTPQLIAEASIALERMQHVQATAKTINDLRGLHAQFHTIFFNAAKRPRMTSIINDWRFRLDSHPETRAQATTRIQPKDEGRSFVSCWPRFGGKMLRRSGVRLQRSMRLSGRSRSAHLPSASVLTPLDR